MIWQDFIISFVSIAFAYALLPQIIYGFKYKKYNINLQTGIITTMGLYVLSFVFFTLDLYFSPIVNFFTGTMWFILTIQSARRG